MTLMLNKNPFLVVIAAIFRVGQPGGVEETSLWLVPPAWDLPALR